ncbi:hypothetical protein TNCV_318891 [Trichonephila clavipes]|nr:hypothetical protein TNCV_318891 [Trichonephila clavipes]
MEIRIGSSNSNSSRHESRVVLIEYNEDQISRSMKEGPNRRKSNPHHKRLQPQTTKKSGVPTNHGEENTTRTTSLSQEKQRMELQHLHRRASKTGQQEYQTIRKSTTKEPGKERRSEYKQNHMSGGPNRRRQLQVIKTIL